MPLKTYNTKADFDADYDLDAEWDGKPASRLGVRLGYSRRVLYPAAQRRAQKLADIFGWALDQHIVIFGAGFGWTAEALEALGYTNILGIDTSPYVASVQNETDEAEMEAAVTAVGLDPATGDGLALKGRLYSAGNRRRCSRSIENESLSNNGSRNRVKNALDGWVDTIFSEEMISCLTDQEVVAASGWCNALTSDVIHYTTPTRPNQDLGFNWKTLAEWKALIPADTFVASGTYEVI